MSPVGSMLPGIRRDAAAPQHGGENGERGRAQDLLL